MSCRRFEYIITTSRESEHSASDAAFVKAHRAECAPCADFERKMLGLATALRSIPERTTGDDFVSAVMAQVRQQPKHESLWERMFGPTSSLHAVRHAYALAGAVAICAIVLVGGGTLRATITHHADESENVAGLPGTVMTDPTDLMVRNQYVTMAQPLSDDPGVRVVSFMPTDEQ